jgi:hypothetical protein
MVTYVSFQILIKTYGHVYKVLEENYQNEYIFKNTFLNTELSKPPLKKDTKKAI